MVSIGISGGTFCDASLIRIPDGELAVDAWLDMDDTLGGSRVGIGGRVDGGGGGGSRDCAIEVGSSACCDRGCCAVGCCDVECCAVECGGMSVRALFAGVACCVDFSLLGACARTVPCECLGVGET